MKSILKQEISTGEICKKKYWSFVKLFRISRKLFNIVIDKDLNVNTRTSITTWVLNIIIKEQSKIKTGIIVTAHDAIINCDEKAFELYLFTNTLFFSIVRSIMCNVKLWSQVRENVQLWKVFKKLFCYTCMLGVAHIHMMSAETY